MGEDSNSFKFEVNKKINKARLLSIELYVTLAIILFSLGFAVFINSAVKILSFENPWKALVFGLVLMIIPLAFGIWKIEKGKKEFLSRLTNLKTT